MFELRDYQVSDLAHYIANPKCMNLSEPGTGKTPSVLVNQQRRWDQHQLQTVWIMPKSIMGKNKKEFKKFTEMYDNVAVVDSMDIPAAPILIMGPRRFSMLYRAGAFGKRKWACDVDEIHLCFGGANSAATNDWLSFMDKQVVESVIMTGTLVNGRLDTTYSSIMAIEPRYYPLGYQSFVHDHAYIDDYGKPYAWRNHDKLRKILLSHGIRRTFADVFGEQDIRFQTEWVELSPKQEKLYRELEDDAMVDLEDDDLFMIDGTNPGVALMRARQIMEHPNKFPNLKDGGFIDIVGGEVTGKMEAIHNHLVHHIETETPVVIFSSLTQHQEAIGSMMRELGMPYGELMAKTSTKERSRLDDAFQAGDIQGIIGSPQIASVGYNWQFWGDKELEHIIFAALGYMDGDFIQGYRRGVREDRATPLRVTTMAYRNSVDMKLMQIIKRKARDANMVDPTRELSVFDQDGDDYEISA
jgi:hypothetical protein